nr:response regulator receiver domain [Brevundimonas sp. BAL450]
MIIDDDYPTYEEVLAPPNAAEKAVAAAAGLSKKWETQPEKIRKVLKRFRRSTPPLIVDIHDGSNVKAEGDNEVVLHLHQSDLLVLDYELDKTAKGDGTKAIEIVRNVLKNQQFNLVVLHTSETLGSVFEEIRAGLLHPLPGLMTPDVEAAVLEKISLAEVDTPDILDQLSRTLTEAHYLYFRLGGGAWPLKERLERPPVEPFENLATQAGFIDPGHVAELARYIFKQRENELLPKMFDTRLPNMEWSLGERPWIRTDTGFIAFSAKQQEEDLIEELVLALADWGPPPSRLFLAKLRAKMDQAGVLAETKALGNKDVLAHWYKRLLDAEEHERAFLIGEAVGRHSDLLMADLLPSVTKFAAQMIKADAKSKRANALCREYFDVDLSNNAAVVKARAEHNAFVCSKAVEGNHLATGHVFEAENRLWVCLTPLCDLVPRDRKDRFGKIGDRMPFVAVRLEEVVGRTPKRIQSNRFVALKLDGEVRFFCIGNESDESSTPHWFNLFAFDGGRFTGSRRFRYQRVEMNAKQELVAKVHRAKLVSQLRYEYALNFMHKLGSSMTRVGLDFAG